MAKLSKHKFWRCHEDGLIKTIDMMPHNLYVSVKLTSLYCGLRIILVYPNPQKREANLKLTYRLRGIIGIVLISLFSCQGQNLCGLSLTFIVDWRVVFPSNYLNSQFSTSRCTTYLTTFLLCLN